MVKAKKISQLKTVPTKASVKDYLDTIKDSQRKKDCVVVSKMMQEATKSKPVMWSNSIVGFGNRKLKYASGRELEWLIIGFSSRVNAITFYLTTDEAIGTKELMSKLGKHKLGKGCLYIKSLSDIHLPTLKKLIYESVKGK